MSDLDNVLRVVAFIAISIFTFSLVVAIIGFWIECIIEFYYTMKFKIKEYKRKDDNT